MSAELSILCTPASSLLSVGLVKVPYMGNSPSSLRDRLLEIADEIGNDAEFARLAKVSRSAVSQWRKGDVKALKAISAANIQERTGYSVRWLILGYGPKKLSGKQDLSSISDNGPKIPQNLVPELLVLLSSFLDTDDEGRKQIVEAVGAITGSHGSPGRQQGKRYRGFKRR
jgi:hypothetical protein